MNVLRVTYAKPNEANQADGHAIVTTYNFQKVQRLCTHAIKQRKMVGLIGDPGLGKTVALKYFVKNNPNCFYLSVKPSQLAKSFWGEFLDTIPKVHSARHASGRYATFDHRSLYQILREISHRLNALESPPLIVIDECGKMESRMLSFLHELHDEQEGRCAIVLSGPPYWKTNLERWAERGIIGIPEVYRRITFWEELSLPSKKEVLKICELRGISNQDIIRAVLYKARSFSAAQNEIDRYYYETNKT